jgi:predicted RNA-binding Zn-ribbon protein involved in translation (DUF1610 family)
MSHTMDYIITEAAAAGVPESVWMREQVRISRDEAEFALYWQDAELCAACGWQGVPERICGGADGSDPIDVCPNCGREETFHCHEEPEVSE